MEFEFEKHCWAEIDLDALHSNYELVRRNAGGTAVCAVVKADAYGHGDLEIAKSLSGWGVSCFAVSGLSEALRLRRGGLAENILILGYTDPACAHTLAENHITQAVFSPDYARALSDAAEKTSSCRVKCHLKVDTGMGRIGFAARSDFDGALEEMVRCFALPGLEVTGMFQHFAVADSSAEEDVLYTKKQNELFLRVRAGLEARGCPVGTAHCCNSAGQMCHPEWHMDMVRAGIILYGDDPSGDVHIEELKPLLTLKSVISQVKWLKPGESVSYGRAFTADKPLRAATICCGYADGYPRLLSGRGVAAVHGKPAPILGRVCMDQMILDVTDIPEAAVGDEVSVFGGTGPQDTMYEAADKIGTISYELLCNINRRVPRLYISGGKPVSLLDRNTQL